MSDQSARQMGIFRLRDERINRGLTIQDLADATGVSRYTITRIEKSRTAKVHAPTAKALADYFGVDATSFYPDPEDLAA